MSPKVEGRPTFALSRDLDSSALGSSLCFLFLEESWEGIEDGEGEARDDKAFMLKALPFIAQGSFISASMAKGLKG